MFVVIAIDRLVDAQIEDCAKDGGEEFFTEMHCVFNRIPIESLKICTSNAMHLGKKFLTAIFSAVLYYDSWAFTLKIRTKFSPVDFITRYGNHSNTVRTPGNGKQASVAGWYFRC